MILHDIRIGHDPEKNCIYFFDSFGRIYCATHRGSLEDYSYDPDNLVSEWRSIFDPRLELTDEQIHDLFRFAVALYNLSS